MPSHEDILSNMELVHATLIGRYKWFIHTTPEKNITSIRSAGLKPNSDAPAPSEVKIKFAKEVVPILCLHPLGAKLCPKGASSTYVSSSNPKLVSFAVSNDHLPHNVGLDWSYAWEIVLGKLKNYSQPSIEDFIFKIAQEFGSVVSYNAIDPKNLRVFCKSNAPADPMTWEHLNTAVEQDVFRHD